MNCRKNTLFALLFLLCTSFTFLHHGWADYDQKKVLDYQATVEESSYGNPHSIAKVTYQEKLWTVYLAPASRMSARGVSADMIKKGANVRFVAYPHKTVKTEMRAERIFIDGKKYELR